MAAHPAELQPLNQPKMTAEHHLLNQPKTTAERQPRSQPKMTAAHPAELQPHNQPLSLLKITAHPAEHPLLSQLKTTAAHPAERQQHNLPAVVQAEEDRNSRKNDESCAIKVRYAHDKRAQRIKFSLRPLGFFVEWTLYCKAKEYYIDYFTHTSCGLG
jgi:hypothetical protein